MSHDYARYRRQAEYCRDQAQKASNDDVKAAWLELAADWLALIPSGADAFDAALKRSGTGQEESASSH